MKIEITKSKEKFTWHLSLSHTPTFVSVCKFPVFRANACDYFWYCVRFVFRILCFNDSFIFHHFRFSKSIFYCNYIVFSLNTSINSIINFVDPNSNVSSIIWMVPKVVKKHSTSKMCKKIWLPFLLSWMAKIKQDCLKEKVKRRKHNDLVDVYDSGR